MNKVSVIANEFLAQTISEEFGQARSFLHAAKMSMAQSAAFMILAGGELERLFKASGKVNGKHLPLSHVKEDAWDAICKRELGISEATAWRYREMFKAAKKRVPMLDASEMLTIPLGEMPELKQAQLLEAVQKVTNGDTPRQLLMDWGICKKPQGSGAKGGAKGGKASETETAEMIAEGRRLMVETLIASLGEALTDKWWLCCDKATCKKLSGLLIDVQAGVREALA